MNESLKEKIKSLPNKPGAYLFKNADGKIIYVGKAISIKKRINQHFQKTFENKQQAMITEVQDIEFVVTKTASEALIMEDNFIKLYRPYFNVRFRDDKTYPYIKLTNEDFPRLHIARKILPDKAKYFGPYPNAASMRQIIKVLRQVFGVRTCHIKHSHQSYGYLIGKCTDACVGKISKVDYAKQVGKATDFLSSKSGQIIKDISKEMKEASKGENFERARQLRDQIFALSKIRLHPEIVIEPNQVAEAEDRMNISALEELKKALSLPNIPERIECYDISNLGQTNIVGSMIVFTNGLPDKKEYRKFKIKSLEGQNDVGSIAEVLDRRFSKVETGEWPLPDLVILDGGKGQLSAGKKILKLRNLDHLPIMGLAKRYEYIFVPNRKEPIILRRFSPALFLLQRIRDEAHRFAITYQKSLRRPKSALEDIPGIGPKRRQLLLQHFGSIENLKRATPEEIAQASSISIKRAQKLLRELED